MAKIKLTEGQTYEVHIGDTILVPVDTRMKPDIDLVTITVHAPHLLKFSKEVPCVDGYAEYEIKEEDALDRGKCTTFTSFFLERDNESLFIAGKHVYFVIV